MENAAVLTLAGLCLGVALSGVCAAALAQSSTREKLSLGLVYAAFSAMIVLPIVKTIGDLIFINFMPILLLMLLALPPAFFHYVAAKTAKASQPPVPLRDLVLPAIAGVVCIGFWTLPAQSKQTMFISGELPPGLWPAGLALVTFALILIWLPTSFLYLIAILRRLTTYRAYIRQLYSNVEKRDLRWVNLIMALLIVIWAIGAYSLADDNLAGGSFFIEELFLTLTAATLIALNIFAPIAPSGSDDGDDAPDLKYARSALTNAQATKLANRIETAMQKDKLYLDANLSLQKLSKHIGALPNQVSQTLNQEIGTSFFDYVSKSRIEASKPLILTGASSVLDVALEVGFNSRSTFYKAFKRETGVTPKDYRMAHQKPA